MISKLLPLLVGGALLLGACGQTPATDTTTTAPAQERLSFGPGVDALAAYPVSLTVGQAKQLTVYVGGRVATSADVTWTSSNTANATVDANGLVRGVSPGSATVRVALRSNPASFLDYAVTVTGTTTTTPTPAPAPAPAPSTGASTFEQRVLELTNQARAQARTCGTQSFAATTPLAYNANLRAAAYNHSRDMAVRNFFSHTNPDGLSPFQRMTNAGYTGWTTAGENIAAGQTTPEQVVAGWLQSPGHCANIMNPRFRDLGVGFYQGGSYGYYWTQDFGAK
ncbi:CAP domain-containing protein [Deinococcus pimensis]|uniref:CAP domain-containing protein n=1 Tax=Deinococcus pimensis TaxID=309888 RepID=UPI0004BA2A07|nr:CAP domain-containing protein [Deinococcus pimensis]